MFRTGLRGWSTLSIFADAECQAGGDAGSHEPSSATAAPGAPSSSFRGGGWQGHCVQLRKDSNTEAA